MKKMILAAFIALAVTAGIASAGIASLASGAAILLDATSHPGSHGDIAYSPGKTAVDI